MLELVREALIHAPPEIVYDLISDVNGYQAWNPWNFRGSGGPATAGGRVTMTVRLGWHTMNVRHEVLESRRGERLAWRDLGWFSSLSRGVRVRDLTPVPEGTRYRVRLTITGPLTALVRMYFGRALEAGLSAETDALKRTAEQRR